MLHSQKIIRMSLFFMGLVLTMAGMYVLGLKAFHYGGIVHIFGRLHPVLLQLSIGAVILSSVFSWRLKDDENLIRFSFLTFILLSLTVLSGIAMELAEHYPNPRIMTHF